MSATERWAAVGAIGAMLAGISEIIKLVTPLVQTASEWIPEIEFDLWLFVEAVGLLIGSCGALIAIWLSLRRPRARAVSPDVPQPDMAQPMVRQRNSSLVLAILALMLTLTVAVAFFVTGGPRSVADTIDTTARLVRGEPPRDTRFDSLDTVCDRARSKYRTRAGRTRLPDPTGGWTGWVSWRSGEQQWRLEPGGGVRLALGYGGSWEATGDDLKISFPRGTVFKVRVIGEVMCGVRLKPRGKGKPDGNFVMVFVAPIEVESEVEVNADEPI